MTNPPYIIGVRINAFYINIRFLSKNIEKNVGFRREIGGIKNLEQWMLSYLPMNLRVDLRYHLMPRQTFGGATSFYD